MTVIDVDSHFEIAVSPEEHPLRGMREVIPSLVEILAETSVGDLRRATPVADQPPIEMMAAFVPDPNRSSAEYAAFAGAGEPRFPSMTADERLAWCDSVGI